MPKNRISTGEGILAVAGGLGQGFIQGRQQKRQELVQDKERAELEKERKRLDRERQDRRIKVNNLLGLIGDRNAPPELIIPAFIEAGGKPDIAVDFANKLKAMRMEEQDPQTVQVGNQEIPLEMLPKFSESVEREALGLGMTEKDKAIINNYNSLIRSREKPDEDTKNRFVKLAEKLLVPLFQKNDYAKTDDERNYQKKLLEFIKDPEKNEFPVPGEDGTGDLDFSKMSNEELLKELAK